MPVKVREALRLLREDGWELVRQRGSHRVFAHPTKRGTVTVAGNPNSDLKPKTWRSIRRQAALDQEDSQ